MQYRNPKSYLVRDVCVCCAKPTNAFDPTLTPRPTWQKAKVNEQVLWLLKIKIWVLNRYFFEEIKIFSRAV